MIETRSERVVRCGKYIPNKRTRQNAREEQRVLEQRVRAREPPVRRWRARAHTSPCVHPCGSLESQGYKRRPGKKPRLAPPARPEIKYRFPHEFVDPATDMALCGLMGLSREVIARDFCTSVERVRRAIHMVEVVQPAFLVESRAQ